MINKIRNAFLLFSIISFSALNAHLPKNKNDILSICPKKDRGFVGAAAGDKKLEKYAPTQVSSKHQLNKPLGEKKADRIARSLGLDKNLCFTEQQYLTFITGQGANGSGDPESAKLVDESVKLLTNTCGNPLIRIIDGKVTKIFLGSYGLIVNEEGMLESPANTDAPTRQVNVVLKPGGYLSTWCKANNAEASLLMLYKSAYTVQLPYAIVAQQEGGTAQLVPYLECFNTLDTGMSMAPSIWEVNFCLIYVLNPKLAAKMPAYWAPISKKVVKALKKSPNGQVPFSDYSSYFKYRKCKNF